MKKMKMYVTGWKAWFFACLCRTLLYTVDTAEGTAPKSSNSTTSTPVQNPQLSEHFSEDRDNSYVDMHKSYLFNFSRHACAQKRIVRELKMASNTSAFIKVELQNRLNVTTNGTCWLYVTGPTGTSLSILLLSQSSGTPGHVKVIEHLEPRKSVRVWLNQQRTINPGPDYLSASDQVYLSFSVTSAGLYTATLHVRAVQPPTDPHLHTRYISTTLGYVQSRGIRLHPSFKTLEKRERDLNMFTYADDLNAWVTLTVPQGQVAVVSVALASLGVLPKDKRCDDRVELTEGRGDGQVVWTLCSDFRSLPPAVLIRDTARFSLHFVSHHSRIKPQHHFLKHGCGFRVVFSFHKHPNIPRQLDENMWNCSTNYKPNLQAHFECNLRSECVGGEDESQCFYTRCENDGVLVGDLCYSLHRAASAVSWYQANSLCAELGGRLAALKTEVKEVLTRVLRLDLAVKSGNPILIGARTVDTDVFMYRNIYQWTDNTIKFTIFKNSRTHNTYTKFAYIHPITAGLVMVYLKALWKLQDVCTYYVCSYLCEREVNRPSDQGTTFKPNPETAGGNTGSLLASINLTTSTTNLSLVQCPLGHITHSFLAFDQKSQCFETGTETSACDSLKTNQSSACLSDLNLFPLPFTCDNGVQRVPYTLVCDHRPDCPDKSDESFCSFPNCVFGVHFQCQNENECQPGNARCDGKLDCSDNSDEIDCRLRDHLDPKAHRRPFLLDFESYFAMNFGFPNLNDLNLSSLQCPHTHFQCPHDKSCLPVYMRCNGVFDCSRREDEQLCQFYTCPNFYRCRSSLVCLHPNHLCDGIAHCLEHTDEQFCNLACSDECDCFGHSMTCHSRFPAANFPELRYLNGKNSGMKMRDVANNSLLIYLSLAGCNISHFDDLALSNLNTLDLCDNKLQTLSKADLHSIPALKTLRLCRNPLSSFFSDFSNETHVLEELDVSRGNLQNLDPEVFTIFTNLRVLNLSHNMIEDLGASSFHALPETLLVLDTKGCPIKTFPPNLFKGLNDLLAVYTDNYKLCCKAMLPPAFVDENCHAPFDEVSSCEDLLRSNIYRVPLSLLASFALLGNFVSFVARTILRRKKAVSGFGVFVLHLCFSDFLMGVYLVFIGVADRVYQGRYLWEDITWRHSTACRLAGFISMASSEVSAFMICLITLDRFIVLRFPFTTFRFGYSSAQITSVAVWTTGVVLAILPLLPRMSHWQFYSQTGICIPLPVTRSDFPGHGYAFGVMITLNFFLFLMIASGQAFVYVSIQSSKMSDSETGKKSQDATIARRLITVVVSDFLCWFPIGLLGLLANSGVPVPGEVSVAMAIFVLPLNSALNPFLYTFNMIQEYTQKKKEEKLFQQILLLADAGESNANPK